MVIAIEGSIGVGKSTVLKELEKRGYITQAEPVQHWTLLPKLYSDPQAYAAIFQVQVLASYAYYKEGLQFLERSAQSARGVFAQMLMEDGAIRQDQLPIIDSVLQMLPSEKPDIFIYLRASAELCQSRVQWRAREGEEGVKLEYLDRLDKAYLAFLPTVKHIIIDVQESDSPSAVANKILSKLVDLGFSPV